MRLRFRIPVSFYVVGPDEASLSLALGFETQGLTCSLSVGTGEPLCSEDLPPDSRHFARGQHLIISVSQEPPTHQVWQDLGEKQWSELVPHLRHIANRCIRGIRNSGIVPGLQELRRQDDNPDALLRNWKVEIFDAEGWRPLLSEPELGPFLAGFLGGRSAQVYAELRAALWPSIEEAIQDDVKPRPEREFTANAIEHVRLGNLRFALLEAIIGLEIVLARFLNSYLKLRKGLSKRRIEEFLTQNLGLTARISGVLELVLTKTQLEEARLDQVLSAVKWRNNVVHRTGRTPEGLPDKTLEDGISAVLGLTDLLAREGESIEAQPAMDVLVTELAPKLADFPRPSVRYLGGHTVGVWFRKVSMDDSWIPNEEHRERIAETVEQLRKVVDRRFDAHQHLRLLFESIPGGTIVRWPAEQVGPAEDAV